MFQRFIPALAAAALVAAPAAATSNGRVETIHFGDLDLTTRDGQDALQSRVRNVIDHICGSSADPRDQARGRAVDDCRAELQTQADEQIKMAMDVSHSRLRLARSIPGAISW